VRFPSDTAPTPPDLPSPLGIGLKLFGVGATALGEDRDSADFILQDHPVFFVDNGGKWWSSPMPAWSKKMALSPFRVEFTELQRTFRM